ncbi:hypothetical protein MXB_5249, partial [Myxobolus squamalis]
MRNVGWRDIIFLTLSMIFLSKVITSKIPYMILKIFVSLYIIIILTTVYQSSRLMNKNWWSFLPFIGMCMFALSDTALIYTMFLSDFSFSRAIIMGSYYSAQYLLWIS